MWTSKESMRTRTIALLVLALCSCKGELDPDAFRREAETAYADTHPGWGIVRRDAMITTFVRGDQLDRMDVGDMYVAYKKSGKKASAWFEEWSKQQEAEAKARKKTLEQAKETLIPIIKSGSWIRVQDLGAIGPK